MALMIKVEYMFSNVSANDLANIIYYHQPRQIRAYWEGISRQSFPYNYTLTDANAYINDRLDIDKNTSADRGRLALVEALQCLWLFRRTSELDLTARDFKSSALPFTQAELNFQAR